MSLTLKSTKLGRKFHPDSDAKSLMSEWGNAMSSTSSSSLQRIGPRIAVRGIFQGIVHVLALLFS